MIDNFDIALEYVLKEEGGYSNHPSDPGGATNKGVTQRVYNAYRRTNGLAPRSVKLLENPELKEIYRENYWELVKGDKLPSGLDYCVFDFAVNSGPSKATKTLQQAINDLAKRNLVVDGLMGVATLEAASSYDAGELVREVCGDRKTWLQRLKTFPVFGKGWTARVAKVRERALQMIRPAMVTPIPTPAELGGDPPKENKLPEMITGVGLTGSAGLLAVVNNPYALVFALVVVAIGSLMIYRKYLK